MRTKELLHRIGKRAPCLACEAVFGKMQQEGLSDFVYAIRKLAEELWGSANLSDETKSMLNSDLADLVRRMSGKEERRSVTELVERIAKKIDHYPSLVDSWREVSESALETTDEHDESEAT